MEEVLGSGRRSDTPDLPILVNARADMPGYFEIADGHHRVAEAIRKDRASIAAVIDPQPDTEPYDEPFFDFRAPCV